MAVEVSRPRVLIADDDPSIRQLLYTIVRREHFDADSAGDGREAIERIKGHQYAVILLDLMMPRVSGFQVIDYLKEHPPALKPVVLVITAYADQKFKEVDASVVAGVLRKPFEIADLGGIVRLCVNGYDGEVTQQRYVTKNRSKRDLGQTHIYPSPHDQNGENVN